MPAGNYRVVTDEELIEQLSFPVYRRVSTMIFVPAKSASSVEIVAIDPQDLQVAQERELNMALIFRFVIRESNDSCVGLLRCMSQLMAVCHEYRRSIRRYATVREMEEGPSRSAIRC